MKRIMMMAAAALLVLPLTGGPADGSVTVGGGCGLMLDTWRYAAVGREYGHGTDTPDDWWASIGFADMSNLHTNEKGTSTLEHTWGRRGGHYFCG